MHRNYCFRRKQHFYLTCDTALTASIHYMYQKLLVVGIQLHDYISNIESKYFDVIVKNLLLLLF